MAKSPETIVGVSCSHGDSSACVVSRGVLIAAAEEERFNRIKHYGLFPHRAVQYCLRQAGLHPSDVDTVAIASKRWSHWGKKAWMLFSHPMLRGSQKKIPGELGLKENLRRAGLGKARLGSFEHHQAHMASARWLAGDDEIALFSFDGLGDFVSTAYGTAKGSEIRVEERVFFPHSLGFFYTALTQYLGFPHFGDEFKVMGLSSYGQPKYLPVMQELVRMGNGFSFSLNLEAFPILKRPMEFGLVKGQPVIRPFYNSQFLTQIIGVPPRKQTEPLLRCHWDLAKSVQVQFEAVANHLLRAVHTATGKRKVALAGGCSHNSAWVGKIAKTTPFEELVVAPACGDAGIAVGAAILAADTPVTVETGHWALLGPDDTASELAQARSGFSNCDFDDDKKLARWIARELTNGKIVGLFQGRMEFGPRALGSRSILCDPRPVVMRDRLNARVKHREMFRPFAVSVLEEHREDWFEDSFYAPTMEAVFVVREEKRAKIPAAVHVDQTCRIQSVVRESQPFYWEVIDQFRKQTGVPLIINTSFNDCEPIVCTQEDAFHCFTQCEMDHLVIGKKVFSRQTAVVSQTG